MMSIVIGHRPERSFWLPGHVRVSGSILAHVALDQAGAFPVEVESRFIIIGSDRENEVGDETPVDPCPVQQSELIDQPDRLLALVTFIDLAEPRPYIPTYERQSMKE